MSAPVRFAFTVDDYHAMAAMGLFGPEERVELLDGEVYVMNPVHNPHSSVVNRLTRMLVLAVEDAATVSVQNSVRLDDRSEPQPDLALLHPGADAPGLPPPAGTATFLVVEVADSSLRWDRDTKAPRYGAAGVPVCWIVDIAGERVLVLTGPGPDGYAELCPVGRGGTLTVPGLPAVAVAVDDVLG